MLPQTIFVSDGYVLNSEIYKKFHHFHGLSVGRSINSVD